MVFNSQSADSLNAELSAMQQIAVALSALDEPTRLRVLNWAAERLRDVAPLTHPLPVQTGPRLLPTPGAGQPTDEMLSVSALHELFAPREQKVLAMPTTAAPQPSVTGMLSEFVAEFQDIAREWSAVGETAADGTVRPEVSHRTGNQRASNAA